LTNWKREQKEIKKRRQATKKKERKKERISYLEDNILLTSTIKKFSIIARWSISTFSARKKSTQ
jgi:hypothetical protein